jgi:hypothetical protein
MFYVRVFYKNAWRTVQKLSLSQTKKARAQSAVTINGDVAQNNPAVPLNPQIGPENLMGPVEAEQNNDPEMEDNEAPARRSIDSNRLIVGALLFPGKLFI